MPHLKYNVDANKLLGAYVSEAFRLRRQTSDLSVGTQEAINQSRALIAKVDDILAMNAMRPGWLWPAYREQPGRHLDVPLWLTTMRLVPQSNLMEGSL